MLQLNKIHNMPCEQGLSLLPDGCADCIVTSPPYGGLRRYKGFAWDFGVVARESYRVLKPGGVLCWNTGDQTIKGQAQLFPERQVIGLVDAGFWLWDRITWQKHGVPSPTPKRYYNVTETVYALTKGEPKTLNLIEDRVNISAGRKETTHKKTARDFRERSTRKAYTTQSVGRRTNIWIYPTEANETDHPAVMNSRLCYDLVRSYTNEGDLVIDPFSGSGTTAVVCECLRRRWLAFEISSEYVDDANKRLSKYTKNLFAND